jgi:hypothetical protein
MNRPVARSAADGSTVLRAGRFYRILLVVNGAPLLEELEAAMTKLGFAGHDLAISPSDEQWANERPAHWPAKALPEIAINEQLVRVSGSFAGRSIRVLVDTPIAGGGTYTAWQAWDVGPSRDPEQRTGAGAPAEGPQEPRPHTGLFVCLALGAVGFGAWQYIATARRLEKEEERFNALEARAERARVGGRIRELMTNGFPEGDAAAIATSESLVHAEEAAKLAPEAEQTERARA